MICYMRHEIVINYDQLPSGDVKIAMAIEKVNFPSRNGDVQ